MNGPDLIVTQPRRRPPSELKLLVGPTSTVTLFNLRHSVGMLLKWRGERTQGEGFMKGPSYLERGILPVVPICGHLVSIPLSWIIPHEDESESESDG